MQSPRRSIEQLLDRLPGHSVLVIGDVVLDEYLVGAPARLSREAPVPVLDFRRRFVRAGGGANPAVNLRALGATPRLLGVVGDDRAGAELRQALVDAQLDPEDLLTATGQLTTTKTRIIAETSNAYSHQVVRLDRGETEELPLEVAQGLAERIRTIGPTVDALLLSDYKAGVVNERVIDAAREVSQAHGRLVTVDSQGDLQRFAGFNLVKCNLPDAEASLHRRLATIEDLEAAAHALVKDLELGCLVITRGPDGLTVCGSDGQCLHLPVENRTDVFDVTGAGDTVAAVLALGLAAGGPIEDAARLAGLAAGVVVRRLGVTTTSIAELRDLLG